MPPPAGLVLLTGATGYVGGRLLHALEERGVPLRCLVRQPERLAGRVAATTELCPGDVLDPAGLDAALAGVDTAYYLVHTMGGKGDFEQSDREGARHFAAAARRQGVRRIIYLGGLGDQREALSPHLRSRHEVGALLRESGCQVVELRASIVIGAGSLSFEMVRALVERLPVMVTPRWVEAEAQPIGIDDLVAYLLAAGELPEGPSRVDEIGGPERLTYGDLMRRYARIRGLRRWMIRVPLLTPRLSSLWLGLVTPLYARVGRKLVESIRHSSVVLDPRGAAEYPVEPAGVDEAMRRALADEDQDAVKTRWCDALSSAGHPTDWSGVRFHHRLVDARSRVVRATPERAFRPIEGIGGANGYYAAGFLWTLRGALDLLVGGVGMRRGRPHPEHLRVGDPLDFWRVEAVEPGRLLVLRAEMKVPGRAWLKFEVLPHAEGAEVRQTALFDPAGLAGLAYWHSIRPLHGWVFSRMLRGIAAAAEDPECPAPA
jgi:uncharacterized protein YbjT (DUF2867 family)